MDIDTQPIEPDIQPIARPPLLRPQCLRDITHIHYINLDSRIDRKLQVEEEFRDLKMSVTRFPAVKLKNGAIGCTMSHIKLLELAKAEGWSHICIVEDDIQFTDKRLFKRQMNAFLRMRRGQFDVAIISGNNAGDFVAVDDTCVKVSACQTTTGYLVLAHYFDTLLANFRDGVRALMAYPDQHSQFAVDKYWFRLQARDRWYLIIPLSVVQREGFSDIEQRQVNYRNIMLDLEKPWLKPRVVKMNAGGSVAPAATLPAGGGMRLSHSAASMSMKIT